MLVLKNQTYHIIHALSSHASMHILVAKQLISHSPKQTGTVFAHLFYQITLTSHNPFKPPVLFTPFFLSQINANMRIFILRVVTGFVFRRRMGRRALSDPRRATRRHIHYTSRRCHAVRLVTTTAALMPSNHHIAQPAIVRLARSFGGRRRV